MSTSLLLCVDGTQDGSGRVDGAGTARPAPAAGVGVVGCGGAAAGHGVTQGRRCGKENCRCADGQLHGPYTYLSVSRPGRRPRLVYVPAELTETVSGQVAVAARVETVLAEITAINTELLARRAPG